MGETIFEERIVHVNSMPQQAKDEIMKQVSMKPESFKWEGYAKITYVTASPPKIRSIEPIEGDVSGYFKEAERIIGATGNIF